MEARTIILVASGVAMLSLALVISRGLFASHCEFTFKLYYWLFMTCASLMTPFALCVSMEASGFFLRSVAVYMCENVIVAVWIGMRWGAECIDDSLAHFLFSYSVVLVNTSRVTCCFLTQYRVEHMDGCKWTVRIMRVLLCLITINMFILLLPHLWIFSIRVQCFIFSFYLICTLQYFWRLQIVVRQREKEAAKPRQIREARRVRRILAQNEAAFTSCMCIAIFANVFWLCVVRHAEHDSIFRYLNVVLTLLDITLNQSMGVALTCLLSGALGAGRRARAMKASRMKRWQKASKAFSPESDPRWNAKVEELAGRGFTLEKLLDFYEALGKDRMPWFDPNLSTTSDVVRAVIIPVTSKDQVAMATVMMGGAVCKPCMMVTHNWKNLFSDLVSAILADALHEDAFEQIKAQLKVDPQALRQWLGQKGLKRTYWVCAFSVNQHRTICGANPYDEVDTASGQPYPVCECGIPKWSNTTAPLLADGRGISCEVNKFDDMIRFLSSLDPKFGQVVAVDADFTIFTRAWCVAEIAAANDVGMKQQLKIWSAERLDFQSSVLTAMRIEDMEASRPEDKAAILAKIPDKKAFDDRLQSLLFEELFPAWSDFNTFEMAIWIGKFVRWQKLAGSRPVIVRRSARTEF